MKKLDTKSIYWLTFSRIVNGDIRLLPSAISDVLEKPVPPYSYKKLSSWFNDNLSIRSQNASFIDRFTLGPDKKPLSMDRRLELKRMYMLLVNDPSINFKDSVRMNIRYTKNFFHIPLNFDALFQIGKVSNAFVRYLFAYSDPNYIAKPHEIDVLLSLATIEYPIQLHERYLTDSKHHIFKYFDENLLKHDIADYEFWALRFQTYQYEFRNITANKIENIALQIRDVVSELDVMIGDIRRRMAEADQDWNEKPKNSSKD